MTCHFPATSSCLSELKGRLTREFFPHFRSTEQDYLKLGVWNEHWRCENRPSMATSRHIYLVTSSCVFENDHSEYLSFLRDPSY